MMKGFVMKRKTLFALRSLYPNVRWVKSSFAKLRVGRKSKYLLPDQLVMQAELDNSLKKELVGRCEDKWQKAFRAKKRACDRLLKSAPCYADRTDPDELRNDMLFCCFGYGFTPDEYLCYELEGQPYEARKSFISDIDRFRMVYQLNDIKDLQIFGDKARTYEAFSRYYGRDAVGIAGERDYPAFERFVKEHPVFVRKNAFESMGRSVEKMDFASSGLSMREFFESILSEDQQILEELVVQSPTLAALHPSSVNTIRCISFLTKHGVEMPFWFMKIGQKGSFVDNGGAGGILVGIDGETGRLNTNGYDEFNTMYEKHPDTGIPFIGYQLPDWEQLRALCREISGRIPSIRYMGWDLAHTDHGWIVIEGNSYSQMIGPQTVYKCGYKEKIGLLMKDVDLLF